MKLKSIIGGGKVSWIQFIKFLIAVILTPMAAIWWKESVVYLVLLSQVTWVDAAFTNWREALREEQEQNKKVEGSNDD